MGLLGVPGTAAGRTKRVHRFDEAGEGFRCGLDVGHVGSLIGAACSVGKSGPGLAWAEARGVADAPNKRPVEQKTLDAARGCKVGNSQRLGTKVQEKPELRGK